MVDARQILQPRFAYYKEVDTTSKLESVILTTRGKDAFRISAGIMEYVEDLEDYKKENTHAEVEHVKDLYGIFGFYKKENKEYLILIEESSLMGPVLKCNIYRVDEVLVIPLQVKSNQEDDMFLGYIKDLVADKSFYYSYNYNLTQTLQTTVKSFTQKEESKGLEKKGTSSDFWGPYQSKFVFNRPLFKQWDNQTNENLWQYVVPVIYGYIFIHTIQFDQKKADFLVISKKDCNRLGRRFVSRGLDANGNASNFVETEHVIVHNDHDTYRVASYVQIRGSIPLLWTQTPTLKYSPKLKVDEDMKSNVSAAEKHFENTIESYGDHVLINLIDKKGSQKTIGEKFTQLIDQMSNDKLKYVWFDFHHECRNMKYENLSKLVDLIKDKIDSFDYFMAQLDYGLNEKSKLNLETCKIMCIQNGVLRTNCMD